MRSLVQHVTIGTVIAGPSLCISLVMHCQCINVVMDCLRFELPHGHGLPHAYATLFMALIRNNLPQYCTSIMHSLLHFIT